MLISGAFLLALILAGILVAIAGGGSHQTTHSTAQHPAASTTTPTSNPTSSTACTLPPGSQAIPSSSPPAGTQWATVGSMQVPQAPNLYGPQRTHGVFNTCFARSPSGALLAALNLWAEGTASGSLPGHTPPETPPAATATGSSIPTPSSPRPRTPAPAKT